MGCCELRESIGVTMVNDLIDSDKNQRYSDASAVWKPSGHQHADTKVKTIEEDIWLLSKSRHWTTDLESPDTLIRTLRGRKRTKNVPVVSGYLKLDREIPPSEIVKAIINPSTRPFWDITVENLEVLKQVSENEFFLRMTKKFPFINREFIIKSYVFGDQHATNIVIYSTEYSSIEHSEDFIRGEIIFGYYKVINLPDQTLFMCMEQVDNQGGVVVDYSLLSSEFTQWIYSFKRFCLNN